MVGAIVAQPGPVGVLEDGTLSEMNLAVDDEAALLFVDFVTGASLQLSGTAQVEWTSRGTDGDDGDVGRRVAFTVGSVVASGDLHR